MNSWVEKILPFEREAFLWLNSHHTPFWDSFMWIYSGKLIWLPLVLVCLFAFVYKIKWQEWLLLIIAAILVGALCDQLSASVIKPIFERYRPSRHPDFKDYVTLVNGYTGGRFGFVSAHAANGFGVAMLSSLLFKYRYFTITIFTWALITCYSRIYLGVHFISDIIGGMFVGIFSALLVYYSYIWARKHFLKISKEEACKIPLPQERSKWLMATIGITVLGLLIYSAIQTIQS